MAKKEQSDGTVKDTAPKVDYTPQPEMLGTGAAQKAGSAVKSYNDRQKARLDQIMRDMHK